MKTNLYSVFLICVRRRKIILELVSSISKYYLYLINMYDLVIITVQQFNNMKTTNIIFTLTQFNTLEELGKNIRENRNITNSCTKKKK